MAEDLSSLSQINTPGIRAVFSKREGKERQREDFERQLKRDGEDEEDTNAPPPTPKPHHHKGAPRGKLIDYEA